MGKNKGKYNRGKTHSTPDDVVKALAARMYRFTDTVEDTSKLVTNPNVILSVIRQYKVWEEMGEAMEVSLAALKLKDAGSGLPTSAEIADTEVILAELVRCKTDSKGRYCVERSRS